MILEGKKINFLGDSITEGHGCKGEENFFSNVLMREAHLAAARNYGIGGTRIARQKGDDPATSRAYCDRFGEMDDDADIIVVFGGTNDYGHGDAPIGTFADRTGDTYSGACHMLMSGLIEKYPAATIVFMTPVHRSNEDTPSYGNGKPLSLYAEIIREVAAYYALPVLDLYSMSGIQPNHPVMCERYCPDGLHPNAAGHALIASRLKGFLETL